MRYRSILAGVVGAICLASAPAAFAGKANDTLVWATDKEVNVVLPFYNNLRETVISARHMWDTLLYRNPETFEYEPLLATSYKWVDDVTLEFELREGVKFHDGSDFNADDVVSTINHIVKPDSGVLSRNYYDWMERAEKLDDYKVRIHMKAPYPAALEMLAGPIAMMPDGIWEQARKDQTGKADYGTVPAIGTGPYKLVELVPSEGFTMERFDDYFGGARGAAKIKTVRFRTIADPETQIAELMTGGIDWIWDVPLEKAEQLAMMPQLTVVNADTMRVSYLAMDAAGRGGDHPFTNVKVRQAVAHAIDRESIAKNLIGGASRVVHTPCYPTQVGCTQDVPQYEYNPDKAKELLAEAGFPNGFVTDIYAYRERHLTEATMGYLQAVGIRTNLKYMQYQALRGLVWDGKTPLFHMTWGSSSVNDVSAFTSLFFSGGRDDSCRDEEVISAIKEGDTTVDPEKRAAAYKRAMTRIAELVCWVPMFTYSKYYAFSADLDFTPSPDELPEFYRASWK
ncbi:MAG: ABC transporter substrate-binding protein [Alphaproteobacteria bacterium]